MTNQEIKERMAKIRRQREQNRKNRILLENRGASGNAQHVQKTKSWSSFGGQR